jgi:hypothetical protein
MINPEELAVCRRRGHPGVQMEPNKWRQCKSCGTWLREIRTIEEREDAPPYDDIDLFEQSRRRNEERRGSA